MGLFGLFKGKNGGKQVDMEEDDDDEDEENQRLSVRAAADIWLSNGMDEDYTFGYTEEELRRALRK